MEEDILLLIPDKKDEERDLLAEVWANKYGEVLRIGKFWVKPETNGKKVAIYGNDSFCLVLAQILNLKMVSVRDEMICEIGIGWIKREITEMEIGQMDEIIYPKFIKSVIPKLFKGQIYGSQESFEAVITGLKPEDKILVSNIIEVESEVRSFILEKKVLDLAFYEGNGNIEEARLFLQSFLESTVIELPKSLVIDLGYNKELGWFIIEFNSSWGAGLNFCNPEKIVDSIRFGTEN